MDDATHVRPDATLWLGLVPQGELPPDAMAIPHPHAIDRAIGEPALAAFLDRHWPMPHHRLEIRTAPGLDVPSWVLHTVESHRLRAGSTLLTAQTRSAQWAVNFLRTLQRRPRWATMTVDPEPWRGLPVFLVGAGHGLDHNGHLLREAHKRGPIVTVNTGLGVCLHHGVAPDVVVCAEMWELAGHFRDMPATTTCVLDAFAAPANWDAAGPSAVAMSSARPYTSGYALEMGAASTHYTSSTGSAMAALALYWGASPLVMVGQSMGGLKPYADGAPYAESRATIDESAGTISYAGGGKHSYTIALVKRRRIGGAADEWLPSDHQFSPVLDWYGRLGERVPIINATEHGCMVANTFEHTLAEVIARYPERERAPLRFRDAPDPCAVLARIRDQARETIAARAVRPAPDFDLLKMWTVPAMVAAHTSERRAVVAEATQRGAREVLEVLG